MTKRRHKKPAPPPPHAELPFSGYDLKAARAASADRPSRSAKRAPDTTAPAQSAAPPATTADTPIPRVSPRALASGIVRIARPTPHRAPDLDLCVAWTVLPASRAPMFSAPWTLLCEACVDPTGAAAVVFVVTTCAEDYAAARARHYVTLHGAEWAALTLAAELDRVTRYEFERWLVAKQHEPSWELTPHVTLGCFIHRGDQRALTVGQVLRACGASLLAVADTAPAPADFWEV